MAINGHCSRLWLSSPPRPIKAHLEPCSCPLRTPIPSSLPHVPPRPLTRCHHRGPPPAAAILHHWPSSRPSPAKVSKPSQPPRLPLPFAQLIRGPSCLGCRRFGRPELHHWSPLFKIRLSPSVSSVGEHVLVIPSISSLRFASHSRP
jgi:hypothetical protein